MPKASLEPTLEFVETTKLIAELKERSQCFVAVYMLKNNKDEHFVEYDGNAAEVFGLCTLARRRFLRILHKAEKEG